MRGFCRYNLKRKIAGLPPVTKDWFDSRKEQLSSTAALAAQQTWTDPLTKRRFGSENTYNAFVRSKKYQDLVKKSGQPQPKPYISIQRNDDRGDLPLSLCFLSIPGLSQSHALLISLWISKPLLHHKYCWECNWAMTWPQKLKTLFKHETGHYEPFSRIRQICR